MRRFAIASLLTLFVPALVSAASPSLSIITPRGVQRGSETVLRFSGQRLEDAAEVLFYRPGVTVKEIKPVNANAIDVTVTVAPDCRMGEHVAQVRTKSGISDYRTFFVGPFPEVQEKEPNSEFETPQAIEVGVTVAGIVQAEDVDYYAIQAKKGQRISVEIEAMRLGTRFFDPYVAILDSKRFELATADDTPLLYQDAAASAIAPEDGQYIIEIRESAYGGRNDCRYRAHIGHFPRPLAVYPAGGKVGEQTSVTFVGDPSGDFQQQFTLPAEIQEEFGLLPQQDDQVAPSENPFRLSQHGNVLEVEPNNDFQTATAGELPLAFNGIIQESGDYDYFRFSAKKGQTFEVECYSRRIRSPLDPVMHVFQIINDGKGLKTITGNDDSRGPDSYFRFTVPADGEYAVRIYDHLLRGGPNFVYRVEFQDIEKTVNVSIPQVSRYSQYRQTIFVPRGNRFATTFSFARRNFGGDLSFDPQGLPQGIQLHTRNVPSNMNSWPVVFEATADAPVEGGLVDFQVHHVDPKQGITGRFSNSADLIVANPGQSRFWTREVNRLAIAVVDEVPFHLEIVQPKTPLVQNGTMNLKVVAHKKEGWDEDITLEFPFRPPGIGTNSRMKMPKGSNELIYPLNANGSAAVGKWPVYVIGQGENKGASWVASQLAELEVSQPYVKFALQRTATEQGKPTEIVAKIEHLQPFEGSATAKLQGLPNKVATEDLTFTKDTEELVFKVTTDPASPAGRHKSVFAEVTVPQAGETVIHRHVGQTELRIDKPLPPPKDEPKKPEPKKEVVKKPEPKKEAPPKRLTRLEQLRLDAQKRAEAEK